MNTLNETLQNSKYLDIDREQLSNDIIDAERSLAYLYDEQLGEELEEFLNDHLRGGGLETPPSSDNPLVGPDEVEDPEEVEDMVTKEVELEGDLVY
ncbi:MAG TPA: hypothetical protein PL070_18115 [Flavobacteriales bacterium]|nr:hypothetical protein [Flavobacteriales bacterium]